MCFCLLIDPYSSNIILHQDKNYYVFLNSKFQIISAILTNLHSIHSIATDYICLVLVRFKLSLYIEKQIYYHRKI